MADTLKGIFLSRRKHTSGSLITTFLTEEGLRTFYFRGGEKKSAGLYPLAEGTVIYTVNSRSELNNMTAFELDKSRKFIFQPSKIAIAFFLAELISKCTTENNPDSQLYASVEKLCEELENAERVGLFPLMAMIKLMDPLGILITNDATSNRNDLVLNISEGTIMSGTDTERTPGGLAVQLLNALINQQHPNHLTREITQAALILLVKYYTEHFPGISGMKSLEVLKETME